MGKGIFIAACKDFIELPPALVEDHPTNERKLDSDSANQNLRRNFVRSFGGFFEGTMFALKGTLVKSNEFFVLPLAPAEMALLAEESYSLNDDGEIITQPVFLKALRNLKFLLQIFPKANGFSFNPNYSDHKFGSLQKSIKVRNRLMHPKSTAEFNVADEEITAIKEATSWLFQTFSELLKRSKEENHLAKLPRRK
jgi:hypothetical protein